MRHANRIILLTGASAAILAAQSDPPGRAARLGYVHGPVSLQPAGVTDWVDAGINRPLTTGDHLWIGDGGQAEIHVGSTALRLNSNTAFQFLNLDDQMSQIQLSQGTLTARVRNFGQGQNVEIDTPSMAFTVLRAGEYRVAANPDAQTSIITVRAGDGEVTGGGQTFPVHAREQAVVTGGDQITYDIESAPGPDAWDRWSTSRDRREDRSPSARYVSREVPGYEDLDQYGQWSNQPGYGEVWRPSRMAANWAPYHDGHWAWVAPWGWTWVDDQPWGYAPSHYGRWASFDDGWGWVPGPLNLNPYYAPALVGWVGGGRGGVGFSVGFSFGSAAAVGWFPLGPRDPYIPGYETSQGYFNRVNNTNTTINNTTINNYYNGSRNPDNAIPNMKYANQNVANAVMAVPQNSFANGRPVSQSARVVPASQLAAATFAAAPAIAPQQASLLGPRAATAASAPHPPAAIFTRPVVARTAPPPAPMAFSRQQAALAQSPGRPLAPAAVQQMRQSAPAPVSPVRVINMTQVQRVQPTLGAGPQSARQANPPPNVAQRANTAPIPAANNRSVPLAPANAARPNTVWSAPAARPGAPPPNAAPRLNAPPAGSNAAQPNTPFSSPAERPAWPQSHTAQQPKAPPPSSNNARPGAPWSNPVARPGAPPQRQHTPAPSVAQRPGAPSPNSDHARPITPSSAPVARPAPPPPQNIPAEGARGRTAPSPANDQRSAQPPAQTYRPAPASSQPTRSQDQQVQRSQVERLQPRPQPTAVAPRPQPPKPEKRPAEEKGGGN